MRLNKSHVPPIVSEYFLIPHEVFVSNFAPHSRPLMEEHFISSVAAAAAGGLFLARDPALQIARAVLFHLRIAFELLFFVSFEVQAF